MKTSAIIRIVIWSLVACLLVGVLYIGLTGGFNGFSIGFGTSYSYKNADRYQIGSGQTDGSDIHTIEINWARGKVRVQSGEGAAIRWDETSDHALKDSQRVHYLAENGVLKLQFRDSSWFHLGNSPAKELTVTLPAGANVKLLEIDNASGGMALENLTIPVVNLETVSGDITAENIQGDSLDLDTVSGDIKTSGVVMASVEAESISGDFTLSGEIHNWNWETVSGAASLTSAICPREINTDTVSGDIKLAIPENDGFTAHYDGASGNLNSDFPIIGQDETYIYKDGSASFSFESVSGDIQILKAGS